MLGRMDRRCVVRGVHSGDETVADLGNGLDETLRRGGVAERIADALDGAVHAVIEVDERLIGPESLSQLLPSDDGAGAANQQDQ